MPELYHKAHNDILLNRILSYNSSILEGGEKVVNPYAAKKIKAFYTNKSRYLIPLTQKVCFVPNKNENQQIFIAKLLPSDDKLESSKCYLITDTNFVIKNLTANFFGTFDLDFDVIKLGKTKITELIQEILDEAMNNCSSFENSIEETDDEEYISQKIIKCFQIPTKFIWKIAQKKVEQWFKKRQITHEPEQEKSKHYN